MAFAKLNQRYLGNGWTDFRFLSNIKNAEFNFEPFISNKIFDISYGFFINREKLIFGPINLEKHNTAKFWRDMADFDLTPKNYKGTTGFISVLAVDLCNWSTYNFKHIVFILSRNA